MKMPRHVHAYVDRHGKARFYLRRKGCPQIPLPGLPWSPEFMTAYEAAMSDAPKIVTGNKHIRPGSVGALVNQYYNSTAYSDLAAETKRSRSHILNRFTLEHGDKPVAKLQRDHIVAMLNAKKSKRFAARNWLIAVRVLMQWAVDNKLLKEDPTLGVKNLSAKSAGFRTWDEGDIAAFEKRWPVGSRERLALALGLYTGQRRSDVIRMGRQAVRGDTLSVTQQKTRTSLLIPIHSRLADIIKAMPKDQMIFLTVQGGGPFTPTGFGNWFHEACKAAGLPPGTSFHGLRKAACRRLAEAGCSANVIASISGHKSLAEVERYTKAADQARMARDAVANLDGRLAKSAKKASENKGRNRA
jgi:integrase